MPDARYRHALLFGAVELPFARALTLKIRYGRTTNRSAVKYRRLPTCSPSVVARRRPPTIDLATPFRAEPGWFTGAPSFRVPIPEPAIPCSRGRGSATRGFCEAIGDPGLPNNPSHKPAAIARHDGAGNSGDTARRRQDRGRNFLRL